MASTGSNFIKLPRSIVDWEWFDDPHTLKLFIYILHSAASKPCITSDGVELKPGQLCTSRRKLAADLKLSEKQIRTALKHLKSTGEISIVGSNRNSVITANNRNRYRGEGE